MFEMRGFYGRITLGSVDDDHVYFNINQLPFQREWIMPRVDSELSIIKQRT